MSTLIPSTEIYEERSPDIQIDFQDASEINTDYLSKTKISDQDLLEVQAATDILPFNIAMPTFEEDIESNHSYSDFRDHGIPEMNIFLVKVAGSCFVAALSSLILLFHLPVGVIYLLVMGLMVYHLIIDYKWKCKILQDLLFDSEDVYRMIDEFFVAVATLFMYLKYKGVMSFSTFAVSLFIISLMMNVFRKLSKKTKILAIILRIGYVLQSSLISLRFDQFITYDWNFVFIPAWIYLLILMIQQTKTIVSLYKKLKKRGQMTSSEEFSMKIGYAWYIGYSGLALMALTGLFGIVAILNDQSNRRTLVVITIITASVFSALFVATIAFRRHLVPFLLSYNLVNSTLLNYYASQPREPVKQIDFETQCKEKFFVMVSSTYFQPMHKPLTIKVRRSSPGGEITQKSVKSSPNSNSVSVQTNESPKELQKQETKEDESQCYLCYSNPADAILMGCGHGGICHACAITSLKKKDECMECRTKVEGIYKIDLSSQVLNTVKGTQFSKVIVEEI